MAERLHVQHYHTTNSGSTPSATDMLNGEIALNINKDHEKIYFKNTEGEIIVAYPSNTKLVDTNDVIDDVINNTESNACIKYTPQTLTEEQKAQARANIGVNQSNLQCGTWE